jgi:tryptophan-rich sensory protein
MAAVLVFLAVVAAAALLGTQFQPGAWYAGLAKPAWTPPNWVFGPVWTILYIAIAIAGWLVWRRTRRMSPALWFWSAQIVLNAAWSWLFFGLQRPGLALVDIGLLLAAIAGFILAARRESLAAAVLFVPYLLWVGYASALNLAIWRMNP